MERYTRIRIIVVDSKKIHVNAKSSYVFRWREIETREEKKREAGRHIYLP